jgi:flagellar biosynthesis protein FlhB
MAENDTEDSEKTEEPTSKKLDDAHSKGDVAKSQEVSTWFVLLSATLMFMVFGYSMSASLGTTLRTFIESPHDIAVDGEHMLVVWSQVGWGLIFALGLPLGLLILGGLSGNLIQHRLVFSAEQMKPKWSKISPLAGTKRLFSMTSLANFAKGIAKLSIVGFVMFLIMWPERDQLTIMVSSDLVNLLPTVRVLSIKLMIGVVAVMSVIAAIDFLYQQHKWQEKQKMTIKELRDEHKQMEGDPTIKAKLRQVRIERGRKRMMASVPNASVVITNPTHYAIALQYEQGMGAPVCLAKGADKIALKIREVAEENNVPLVENPPLARALFASVEVDDVIPSEHYKAVAQVIGYVMRIRGKLGRT